MAATVTSRPDSLTSAFEPWPLAEQWPGWGALLTEGFEVGSGLAGFGHFQTRSGHIAD